MNTEIKISVFLLIFVFSVADAEVSSRGVLRLRIGRFSNPENLLEDASCCSHQEGRNCTKLCSTFFRVCANTYSNPLPFYVPKHIKSYPMSLSMLLTNFMKDYRKRKHPLKPPFRESYSSHESNSLSFLPHSTTISPKYRVKYLQMDEFLQPCNLGKITTKVVAKSSLKGEEDGVLEIQLPFKLIWPITFTLTIEAWNSDVNKSIDLERSLISRHTRHHSVKANGKWIPFKYSLKDGKTIHYSVMVSCKNKYFGNNCNMRCDDVESVARNDRINCTSTGEVRCLDGWTGKLCNKAVCREECHPVHGYCTQPGECKCALGWRGKNCDECVPLPGCKHGFCRETSYECICEPGWEGNYCSIPVCKEGCHSTRGYCKYPNECRCRIGWGGETCEECKPLPGCVNGYCIKPLECKCREGWTGLYCNTPTCKANCSDQHGYCLTPGECRCEVGWWGENCETCFPYPGCKHGTCEDPWECNCKEGWKGILCDHRNATGESFCEQNRGICLNGGTCINVADERNYTCSCPVLFTGEHCDYLAYSRASIFPIFSRGSVGARKSFSTPVPTVNPVTTEEAVTESPDVVTELIEEIVSSYTENKISKSLSGAHLPRASQNVSLVEPLITYNKSEEKNEPVLSDEPLNEPKEFSIGNDNPEVQHSELLPISERSSDLFTLDDKKRKFFERQSQSKSAIKETNIFDKDKIFSELFPNIGSHFFSERSFIVDSPTIPKSSNTETFKSLLDPSETSDIDDEFLDNPIVNTDANSPLANQIHVKEKYLSRASSLIDLSNENTGQQSSVIPLKEIRLLSQDRPPKPSNLRVSPFVFTAFDSFPLESSQNERSFSDLSHLVPQTRIDRKIENPLLKRDFISNSNFNKFSNYEAEVNSKESVTQNPLKEKAREDSSTSKSYYEENYAGRVHIGDVTEVDKHAPFEEIYDAFIELKKLTS